MQPTRGLPALPPMVQGWAQPERLTRDLLVLRLVRELLMQEKTMGQPVPWLELPPVLHSTDH